MDDLDRLAFRLVRTVRNSYPHLLDQEFTLTDLEERLLPFRDARREMSDTGPEAWEVNVLRMVSGEREYLRTEADLQLACRQALSLPSPTLALVRPWSATTLRLGASAANIGGERLSSTTSDPFAASALGLEFSNNTLRLATPAAITAEYPVPSGSAAAVPPQGTPRDARRATPDNSLRNCGCRFCGGKLPDGRKLTFCPHCGVNLTIRQCPACSTELDVNWRFCVTCGRGSDVPELPQSPSKVAAPIAM